MIKDIQACSPTSQNFLSEPDSAVLAQHYKTDLKPEEVVVARNFLKWNTQAGGDPNGMITLYNQLDGDMFPSLKALIQAAITIPVSSCSCERSFSALRHLHNWLRGTMGQNRLHHLAVMSVERDIFGCIDQDKLTDRSASMKDRRHTLMIPAKKITGLAQIQGIGSSSHEVVKSFSICVYNCLPGCVLRMYFMFVPQVNSCWRMQ